MAPFDDILNLLSRVIIEFTKYDDELGQLLK